MDMLYAAIGFLIIYLAGMVSGYIIFKDFGWIRKDKGDSE